MLYFYTESNLVKKSIRFKISADRTIADRAPLKYLTGLPKVCIVSTLNVIRYHFSDNARAGTIY